MSVTSTAERELRLSHNSGDTVNHSVVLLEGEFSEVSSFVKCGSKSIEKIESKPDIHEGQCAVDVQDAWSRTSEIFVYSKESCQVWPVVGGKFKTFVKLEKGINELRIECPSLQLQEHLFITYEKMELQPRFVRVVYIKCCDSEGKFDSPDDTTNDLNSAVKKLRLNALLLQTFMAVDMDKHGFGYQTFRLEEDENGEVLVHVFDSKLTTEKAHQMTGDELYSWFHSELSHSSLNDQNCKFLAFMSCSHYDPPEEIDPKQITKYVKAHTALGGGQLGLFGTAGLHTWAGDLGELVRCFTDSREIDKRTLFDDSAGRGTFWANYSTTLGAALHELGHCFDLMHTPEGIMARGFDDMNQFYTVTKPEEQCLPTKLANVRDGVAVTKKIFADHRAHWFRSSAVVLHYHKWLHSCAVTEEENGACLEVNWSSNVKGPVGNGGGGQKNQSYFDDKVWCSTNGHVLSGYVVYHGEYINALKPLVISHDESSEELPLHGKVFEKGSVHIFPLEEGEYFTSVEVRAGAWIDGIRFHTNMKSSIWFGGQGGNWYHLKPSPGDIITGIFGSFGDFVGSLGVHLSASLPPKQPQSVNCLHLRSDLGIRLIEHRIRDELINFWEFTDKNPPNEFKLPCTWSTSQEDLDDCNIFVLDNGGNISESGFVGFERFQRENGYLERTTKEVVTLSQMS